MASCKLGHVYIVQTALTKPPKAKFAICVCVSPDYFLWINTKAAPHGSDQLKIDAGCHELIKHDSHVDVSRIVFHQPNDLESAKEFEPLPLDITAGIVSMIDSGLEVMPPAHAAIVREGLQSLLSGRYSSGRDANQQDG